MRDRYLKLGLVGLLLAAISAAYVVAGTQFYAQYRVAYADYRTSCDALISWNPPASVYTALYVNQPAFVTVRYRAPAPETLRIHLEIPQFTQDQTVQVEATTGYHELPLKPPLLDAATLDALVSPRQRAGQLHLRVESASATLCDTSVPVVLKSRQWMRWEDTQGSDTYPYLAGWVTPQAPVVAALIGRSALWLQQHPARYSGLTRLAGYDEGNATASEVRAQVDAIFDTLQYDYRLHYAADNIPFDRDQLIQLPKDVLAMGAPVGMCVETTAILASAVERLGMRPSIVIVPGHAFLGVALGSTQAAGFAYWETSDLNGGVNGSQATIHGDDEYATNQRQGLILRVIDVQAERQQGIEPIE